MLRLNSQHAKTYFNQNSNSINHMETYRRGQGRSSQNFGYAQNQMPYNVPPQQYQLQEFQRRSSFTGKNHPKMKEISQESYQKSNHFDRQDALLRVKQQNSISYNKKKSLGEPSTIKPRENPPQRQVSIPNLYQRERCLEYKNQKHDYLARHQKRNQRIRNSLFRDNQPERRQGFTSNQEEQEPARYNQSFKGQIMSRNQNPRDHEETIINSNRSHYSNSNYRTNEFQGYDQGSSPILERKQDPLYSMEAERVNSIRRQKQMSYECTPDKKQTLFSVPGSAERKQSLIEKSQQLQKKLKNINITVTSSPSPQDKQTYAFQSRYEFGKRYEGKYQTRPSVYSSTNADPFQGKTAYPEQSYPQMRNCNEGSSQNKCLERTYSNPPSQALDKISQLNEKISQRIQSIISNYAKQ